MVTVFRGAMGIDRQTPQGNDCPSGNGRVCMEPKAAFGRRWYQAHLKAGEPEDETRGCQERAVKKSQHPTNSP
jgi:hypothetical protein